MKKYKCTVCGHIQDTNHKCELCGVGPEKFVEVEIDEENLVWAQEHELGSAKGVDAEIYAGLLSCFDAEVTEVGMYLAMARVAYREGYPEIGEVLRQIAWEEADHAAKFEELAQDKIFSTTKENLNKMIHGENGACELRWEIAKKAKQLNLDAIHDTVHEISKDEARHGKALQGLLKRYFQ
ncbi:ferritin family protein [Mycoplasma sp. P36-A1]|uniref:ferritin family protein n=1 Tax=Mycoplasma sp. P36-A1 TaxID=3252900 RepID=UPI003C2DABAB